MQLVPPNMRLVQVAYYCASCNFFNIKEIYFTFFLSDRYHGPGLICQVKASQSTFFHCSIAVSLMMYRKIEWVGQYRWQLFRRHPSICHPRHPNHRVQNLLCIQQDHCHIIISSYYPDSSSHLFTAIIEFLIFLNMPSI